MKTGYCRICFTNKDDLTEICNEIREIFYFLTNIHLNNTKEHSNFICQECKIKLQSTRQYIRLLTENETRLMNQSSTGNAQSSDDDKIFSYFPEIKIENDEFEFESDQISLGPLAKELKHKSNRGRKRKSTELTEESPKKQKVKKLKILKDKVPKINKRSSKPCKEISNNKAIKVKSSKTKDLDRKSSKSSIKQDKPIKQLQSKAKVESDSQNEDLSHLQKTKNGKIICQDCNRPILKSNYKDHINQKHVGNNIFICDLCHKKFHRKNSLECHMYVHLKIKPYTCPENCGKSFYSKHGLYFHYKMHHQPINEFICEICAKSFKQSHLLQEHIDAKHSGVRYKCTYEGCGNQYNTNSGLKKHIISIHECKIVPCEFCGELFRTGFSLYQHVRINHKERKFVCEYEGCDKKFVIKTHYRDHLKMHTGKKDFICKLCDASYHKKRNLTRHVEVVHQKSRFYCQVDGCNAALCNKDNYRAHLRKVHSNHSDIKDLLADMAKMKPVYLENFENMDEKVEEQS